MAVIKREDIMQRVLQIKWDAEKKNHSTKYVLDKVYNAVLAVPDWSAKRNGWYHHGKPYKWTCESCGETVQRDQNYCGYCGRRLY